MPHLLIYARSMMTAGAMPAAHMVNKPRSRSRALQFVENVPIKFELASFLQIP